MPSKMKRHIGLGLLLLLCPLAQTQLLQLLAASFVPFGKSGHNVEHCLKFEDASKKAKGEVRDASNNNLKKWPRNYKGKANAVQENQTPSMPAGVASICLSSSPSTLPDTWSADTGATSHMMHRLVQVLQCGGEY
jgi:hypothetical protein